MLKASHFFIRLATLFVGLGYLLLAVYLAAGYYFMDRLADYKVDIETFLTNETGLVWKVDNLHGHLQRYNPVFHVDDLEIYAKQDASEAPIKLSHAQVQIDLLASVFNWQLIIKELRADTFSIRLTKHNERWTVEGIRSGEQSALEIDEIENLLEHLHAINIDKIAVNLTKQDVVAKLPDMNLELRSALKNRQLIFAAKPQDEQQFKLIIDFDRLSLSKDSVFSAYVQAEQFSSQDWFSWLVDEWSFENWTGELWLEKQYNSGIEFTVNVKSGSLIHEQSKSWQLSDIEAIFAGHMGLQGEIDLWWQFGQAKWNAREITLPAAQLSLFSEMGRLTHLVLQAETIDVAYLNEMLLNSNLLFDPLVDILSTLNPSGLLKNMYLHLPISQAPEKLQLKANLSQVNVSPWKNIPGAENVNGYVESGLSSGFVDLDTHDEFTVAFPNVYAHTLQFDSAQGRVDWSVTENAVKVAADPISLTVGEESLSASFYIEGAKKKSEEPGYMSLNIGAQNTRAETLLQYVPKTLNTNLLEWINNGKLSGKIDEGGFAYAGPLKKGFADKKNVLLFLKLAGTNLYFDPAWPKLESVNGLLTIHNNHAEAAITQAEFSGLRVSDMQLNADFSRNNEWLTLSSNIAGSLNSALKVLKSPALENTVGRVVNEWSSTTGTLDSAKLNIILPLSKNSRQDLDIDFSSRLTNADLILENIGLKLSDISGPIQYTTSDGLLSKAITANLWGKMVNLRLGDFTRNPFNINLQPQSTPMRVDIQGELLFADIAKWLNLPVLGYVKGQSNFHTQINVAGSHTQISVQSNLDGAQFMVPSDIKPLFEKQKHFKLDWSLDKNMQPMSVNLSDFVHGNFYFDDFSFQGGVVSLDARLNKTVTPLNERALSIEKNHQKIVVNGQIETADLDDVLQLVDQYSNYEKQFSRQVEGAGSAIDLSIERLMIQQGLAFDQVFKQIDLSMVSSEEAFTFELNSDRLIGEIKVPRELRSKQATIIEDSMNFQRPYELDLSYLRYDFANNKDASKGDESLTPADFPALSAEIEQLEFGGKLLSAVSFNSFVRDNAFIVSDFTAAVEGVEVSTKDKALEWSINAKGEQFSYVNLQLSGGNIQPFIDSLLGKQDDVSISPIKSEETALDLSFTWSGAPADFSVDHLQGKMRFNLQKGQFLNSSNSTNNVLKLIGLVNFDTLFRRFQLDFSDLYSEGLAFDSAEGQLLFSENTVSFQEYPIHVKGPSSEFFLNGVADLKASTIDADLIITLPVAKSLPWIVALTGGIPAAVGTLVATKLFENEMNKLSTARYTVSGSLDAPELVFDKLFETKSSENRPAEEKPADLVMEQLSEPDGAELEQEKPSNADDQAVIQKTVSKEDFIQEEAVNPPK